MRVFLFGGAEVNQQQVVPELKLIEKVIKRLKPKQLLHIPFARTILRESTWREGWFQKYIHVSETSYLNAMKKDDIAKARSPLIFISGGREHLNLAKKINANLRLLNLIKNAHYIIGESAGSMILGEYFRSGKADGPERILKALGIVQDTIIEPHYTEREKQRLLVREMKQTHARYGIGIDCVTAIEFDVKEFPKKYKKIGTGTVVVKIRQR